jgi:ribosomal-protein-alanine N-acetyltransferase
MTEALTAQALTTLSLDPAAAELAAVLHRAIGFAPHWSTDAFATLLGMPGVGGTVAARGVPAEPAGLVVWRVAADEAEILTIGVLPEFRGAGIGRRLLDMAGAAVREAGARRCILEVAEDNPAALGLYSRAGFRTEGRRKAYYRVAGAAVDGLIMARDLSDTTGPAF